MHLFNGFIIKFTLLCDAIGLGKATDSYDYTLAADETKQDQEQPNDSVGQFPIRIDMLMSTLKKFYIEGTSDKFLYS